METFIMSNNISNHSSKTSLDMFDMMDKAYKFAEIMAKSDIIPQHYRNKPANVFIAVQTAYRMNLDPMLVMQNTYVVGGKLGMNTTFAISLANNSGLFANGIRYKVAGQGNDLRVTAYTNLKKTEEEISYTVTMKEAQAENWTKNTKYRTLPELMLRYRAATLLIRTHAPEVMNGMHMIEELEDVSAASKDVTPKAQAFENKIDGALSQLSDELTKIGEAYAKKASDATDHTHEPIEETYDAGQADHQESNPTDDHLAHGERTRLLKLIVTHNVPQEVVQKWCDKANVDSIRELDLDKIKSCIQYIEDKYE